MVIYRFHGGCESCTQQEINNVYFCYDCQYFDADWKKPNLNNRPESATEIMRKKVKAYREGVERIGSITKGGCMREIKYRQPLFYNGHFRKFHYWGDIDGGFQSPVAGNLGRNSQEYTGLLDKNGKEIYEGDVVDTDGYIFEVGYITAVGTYITTGMFKDSSEIISNIYENPELIR